jgi:heat shock protein HslJ
MAAWRVALTVLLLACGTQACGQSSARGLPEGGASPPLDDTNWRLVQVQNTDGTATKPDDGNKYTLEFNKGGKLVVRLDCNLGQGSWSSAGESQLKFGELVTSRAACGSGSLYDQFVKDWPTIQSYTVKDKHLFLATAGAATYEFEPRPGL